jgi:hypothetical protein
MQPTDLDPSLAFTALLELDPGFAALPVKEGGARQKQLLSDWYAQDKIKNLMVFTRAWLAQEAASALAEAHREEFGEVPAPPHPVILSHPLLEGGPQS